ncbi:MAG: hypothetical protein WBQ08_04725 [Candidatus Sulfotelmatobacter sp.]
MNFSLRQILKAVCLTVAVSAVSLSQTAQPNIKYAEQQPGATADVQITNCIAALPAYGGICDARSFGATSQTIANPILVGVSPQRIYLILDSRTLFNITYSNSTTPADIFAVGDGSFLECKWMGEAHNFGGEGGIQLASGAYVKSIISSAPRNGFSIFGSRGCTLIGNSSATVTGALIDVQGVGSGSFLADTTVYNNGSFIGLRLQPGTSSGMSDFSVWNTTIDGAGTAGNQPCVIKGNGATQQIGGIGFFGSSCQHAGSGQYELNVNGCNATNCAATGGSGTVPGVGLLQFAQFHVETVSGSEGIYIQDASNVHFTGLSFSGSGTGNSLTLAESVTNLLQDIETSVTYSSAGSAHYLVNTAAGGTTIPVTTSAPYTQPAYNFKMPTTQFVGYGGNPCTNAELALSTGWGSASAISAVHGTGQTCEWTLTSSGTGQGSNPTITDTLTNPLPSASVVCGMQMVGGTGTATLVDQTTLSATSPAFTFDGTPVAGKTYKVLRRCGP